jgi:hypothetical protein
LSTSEAEIWQSKNFHNDSGNLNNWIWLTIYKQDCYLFPSWWDGMTYGNNEQERGVVTSVSPALAANEWAPSSSVSFSRKVALCPHTQAISQPTCKFSYQALQQKDKTLHAQLKQSQLIEYLKRWHAGSWLEESLQVWSLSCNQAPDHISFLYCKSHCHFSRNKMTKSTCTYMIPPTPRDHTLEKIKHAHVKGGYVEQCIPSSSCDKLLPIEWSSPMVPQAFPTVCFRKYTFSLTCKVSHSCS